MTQIFINEIDPPKQPPKKIEDFIAGGDETFVSVPVLGNFLPIKKDLLAQFDGFYKRNKAAVEDFCKKFWKM